MSARYYLVAVPVTFAVGYAIGLGAHALFHLIGVN